MKSSNAKKASITLPSQLEKELQKLAKKEHRTLSGLIQEASRFYLNTRHFEDLQNELATVAMKKDVRSEADLEMVIEEVRKLK